MPFSMFQDTVLISRLLPLGGPFRGAPGTKTNYMVFIIDFQTKRPILDFEVSLASTH